MVCTPLVSQSLSSHRAVSKDLEKETYKVKRDNEIDHLIPMKSEGESGSRHKN